MQAETTFYVYREIGEEKEYEFELIIRGDIEPFVRGRCYGPPERCYPDEGGSAMIESITIDVDGVEKRWTGKLTLKEEREAEEALYDSWCPPTPEPPSYDDWMEINR